MTSNMTSLYLAPNFYITKPVPQNYPSPPPLSPQRPLMMQQAIPYRAWRPTTVSPGVVATGPLETTSSGREVADNTKKLRKLVAENAVVVLARKGCCMCHVVKLLLHGHGVNPTIIDVYEQNEAEVTNQLSAMIGIDGSGNAAAAPQFPAVFVGGELFGGLEEIMGAHISGELVPRLREAGALWL